MANAYTQLGFVKQADGENIGSWGDVLNDQLIDLLDDAIGGYVEVSVASGNVTLAFAEKYEGMLNGFCLFHSTSFADSTEKKENRNNYTI